MRDRGTARRGPSAGAPAGAAGDSAATIRATVAAVAVVARACVALAGVLDATVGSGLTGCSGCGAERPAAQGGAGDALAPVGEREALDWAQTALLYQGAPATLRCGRGIDDREWTCAGMVGFTRSGPGHADREVGWCRAAVIVRRSGPAASGAHVSELDRSACPRDVTAALRASDG
jgi:hypothetical protein